MVPCRAALVGASSVELPTLREQSSRRWCSPQATAVAVAAAPAPVSASADPTSCALAATPTPPAQSVPLSGWDVATEPAPNLEAPPCHPRDIAATTRIRSLAIYRRSGTNRSPRARLAPLPQQTASVHPSHCSLSRACRSSTCPA